MFFIFDGPPIANGVIRNSYSVLASGLSYAHFISGSYGFLLYTTVILYLKTPI